MIISGICRREIDKIQSLRLPSLRSLELSSQLDCTASAGSSFRSTWQSDK